MSDLTKLTIAQALDGLKNKEFSSVELTSAYIDSAKNNKKYNAYVTESFEQALENAVISDKKYADGSIALLKYNRKKVLKRCNDLLETAKQNQYLKDIQTEAGRKRILKGYKKMKKSELKKILKGRNLYCKGMSKSEMIDMLDAFMY